MFNVYEEALKPDWYMITDTPVPELLSLGNYGTVKWKDQIIQGGKQYVYRIKRLGLNTPTHPDEKRRRAYARNLKGVFERRMKQRYKNETSDEEKEDEKFAEIELELVLFVALPPCSSGRFDDFKIDLDPWEEFEEIEFAG